MSITSAVSRIVSSIPLNSARIGSRGIFRTSITRTNDCWKFVRQQPLSTSTVELSTAQELFTTIDDDSIINSQSGQLPATTELKIVDTANEFPKWPVYRILKPSGVLADNVPKPTDIDKQLAVKMYSYMVRVQVFDDIMYNAQRQGRISFYMQATGEEAIHVGVGSSLSPDDMIFAQYREQGVLLWRGFTIQQAINQCYSNAGDLGKGRQMPVHYGSKELNFQTISSPLGTQIPQAVGAAYALKLSKKDAVSVCFFGEGAASEGDFHAALNFASTLEVPIVFFCRNNEYAISTPAKEQYRGDGIASRAAGYGMHAIRVDGNDLLAVRNVVREARKLAHEKCCPVLIEAMTYRVGHHSTSDDSTRYRSLTEIKHWQHQFCPVKRFRMYMEDLDWWDADQEQELRDRERVGVLQAMEVAERTPKPPIEDLFNDVYHTKPTHLLKQEQSMREHIAKYPDQYSDDKH